MNPLFKLFVATHIRLFRWTGGKIGGTLQGGPVLLLTTTGRKTGQARTVPLVYIKDDAGDPVITASAGGARNHPAWFTNLVANPDVRYQTAGEEVPSRAEVLPDEQRKKLWTKLVAMYPNFGEYQKKTSREIPMVALRAR